MDFATFLQSDLFKWVLIPLLIFTARMSDVTLATIRVLFLSRGLKYLASFLGFFEILIWLVAIGQVMQNLDHWLNSVAYAAGFAMGNFVGVLIEEKLAMGTILVRIITQKDIAELVSHLKEEGFGVTIVPAQGKSGNVHLIYIVINRKHFAKVEDLIHCYNPKAFYSVEDVRTAKEGIFPPGKTHASRGWLGIFRRRHAAK